MQFDEKDFEKDNNEEFSIDEDSNAISWDDLLSSDGDVSLEDLIKSNPDDDKADVKEKKETSSIADFDISSLSDDDTILQKNDVIEEDIKEIEVKSDDTNETLKEEANKDFDLSSAAENYVNSIEPNDMGIESSMKEDVSIEKEPGNSDEIDMDDILNSIPDDEGDTAKKEDLSDIVDEELLELLDVKGDKDEIIKSASSDIKEEKSPEENDDIDLLSDLDLLTDNDEPLENNGIIAGAHAAAEEEPKQDDTDGEYVEEEEKKKSSPVLLIAVIVGLIAVLAFAGAFLMLKGSNVTTAQNDNLQTVENPAYNMDDENAVQNNTPADPDADKLQAETEALLAKMEDKTNKEKIKKEEENKENKIVVDVQQGGRINPFVPSALFDENGFASFGADLSVPPDSSIDSPEAAAARKLMSIMVSGIMYDPEDPSAILKFGDMDYFVQAGDRIDDYTVLKITRDYVSIQNGANVYKAYVGEAFKTNESIPKDKQMYINGNSRQYISANDIQISTK